MFFMPKNPKSAEIDRCKDPSRFGFGHFSIFKNVHFQNVGPSFVEKKRVAAGQCGRFSRKIDSTAYFFVKPPVYRPNRIMRVSLKNAIKCQQGGFEIFYQRERVRHPPVYPKIHHSKTSKWKQLETLETVYFI